MDCRSGRLDCVLRLIACDVPIKFWFFVEKIDRPGHLIVQLVDVSSTDHAVSLADFDGHIAADVALLKVIRSATCISHSQNADIGRVSAEVAMKSYRDEAIDSVLRYICKIHIDGFVNIEETLLRQGDVGVETNDSARRDFCDLMMHIRRRNFRVSRNASDTKYDSGKHQ